MTDLKPGDTIRVRGKIGIVSSVVGSTVWYHVGETGAYSCVSLDEVKPV